MEVASFNGVKIYNLSTGKTLPQWLSDKQRRALRKDEEFRRRIELLQDFEFNTASQAVKLSGNNEFVMATGTYPPQVKVFDVHELSMKFERHLNCEVVDFLPLSDDFGKIVFLQSDRTLAFHAPYGAHYALRVPKFGRHLAYHQASCELLTVAAGNEVYRLSLDEGRFRSPIELDTDGGVNKVQVNPRCGLVGFGDETGKCHFWDHRTKKTVTVLDVGQGFQSSKGFEITALNFCSDGLHMGIGTSSAFCLLYDLRSAHPLVVKEHQYGLPIVDVQFHSGGRRVLSSDAKVVKIWQNKPEQGADQGTILTNIEAPADINGVCIVKDKRGDSGLLFIAGEQSRVMSYYVPSLGPAPRWCSFLDSVTEELEEETNNSVYDDYKFVTKQEVEELNISNLIGTPLLKGYMHGFFMDMALYNKLKAVSEPQAYEQWKKKKMKDKLEEKRQSRISLQKKLPKVNREYAQRVLQKAEKMGSKPKDVKNPLEDGRFAALFTHKDFQIDEEAEEFKLRNPSGPTKIDEQESEDEAIDENFTKIEDSSDENDSPVPSDSDGIFSESSDDDDSTENIGSAKKREKSQQIVPDSNAKERLTKKHKKVAGRTPKFYEVDESENVAGFSMESNSIVKQRKQQKRSQKQKLLSQRLEEEIDHNESLKKVVRVQKQGGAVREMTFFPENNENSHQNRKKKK